MMTKRSPRVPLFEAYLTQKRQKATTHTHTGESLTYLNTAGVQRLLQIPKWSFSTIKNTPP